MCVRLLARILFGLDPRIAVMDGRPAWHPEGRAFRTLYLDRRALLASRRREHRPRPSAPERIRRDGAQAHGHAIAGGLAIRERDLVIAPFRAHQHAGRADPERVRKRDGDVEGAVVPVKFR